ncbi:hypothetical protein F5Y04DRAFT_275290 [Hypomontagnella monticulosa]|nr:hypothetical protein F5Y04DRAFT_275290 [Hypomontagnella monticulosa]
MAFESSALSFLIWITILVRFAAGVELSDDIKNFVPTCAQPCLESFIIGNYPDTDCTRNPTLQCMCTQPSNSGYALGEGALQCISAELSRGVCNDNDAGGAVKRDAYLMCSRIANAQSNTHAILTATLADSPTGGPGSLIVASTPTPTPPPSQTPSSTGSGATETDGEATPTPAPASSTSLNAAQIAGIAVGAVGAILITIIAILIVRRIRKRRYQGLEGGFSPMSDGRSRSAGSAGSKKLLISAPVRKLSSDGGSLAQMPQAFRTPPTYYPTPPMKPPRTPPVPGASSNFFLTPNSSMEAVGLAISRSLNTTPSISPETPVQRHQSKLLPAKPDIGSDIGLRVPPPRPLPPPPPEPVSEPEPALTRGPSSRTAQTNRTSILTNMTAFADLDADAAEGAQTWRPKPGDPRTAAPLYVADKYGNWVLNNNNRQSDLAQVTEAAELDTYTALTKSPQERKDEIVAITEAVSAASAVPEKPLPAFLAEDPSANPITLHRSSSVYSQASAIRRSSRFLGWRSNSTKSKKGIAAQVARSDTVKSQDSVTTINTSTSSPLDGELPFELENARLSQLTSVIESAVGTPTPGRSPVKYPKIPGRLNKGMLQVDLAKRIEFGISPPGQPSPTIKGAAAPSKDTTSPYPKPLSIKRSKSSETLKSVKSMKSVMDVEPVPDLPPPPQFNDNKPAIQSPVSRFSPRVPNLEAWPSNSNVPERVQTPPMQTAGSISSPKAPSDAFLMPSPMSSRSGAGEMRPHIARAVSPLSMVTMTSGAKGAQTNQATQGASSLLAKRLGNGKAAALALSPNSKKKGPWRKQGSKLSPFDANLGSPRGSLPDTPTWMPKLTPTRKGDDLVLNVQ